MMPSADRLWEFHTVVREGSISRAAEALVMPRATLSRRISSLERNLGVQLLHRNVRPLRLTAAGERLARRAERIISDTNTAWDEARDSDGSTRGLLRVSLPPSAPVLHRYVVGFMQDYPEVELVVSVDANHVDLARDGIDLAVRVGDVDPDQVEHTLVWCSHLSAFAHVDYLERRGTPTELDQLAAHTCITSFGPNGLRAPRWPLLDGGSVDVPASPVLGDLALRHEAVMAGAGLAVLSHARMQPAIDRGEVVPILADVIGRTVRAHAVHLPGSSRSRQLSAFVDGLVEFMADDRAEG